MTLFFWQATINADFMIGVTGKELMGMAVSGKLGGEAAADGEAVPKYDDLALD